MSDVVNISLSGENPIPIYLGPIQDRSGRYSNQEFVIKKKKKKARRFYPVMDGAQNPWSSCESLGLAAYAGGNKLQIWMEINS